MGRKKKKFVKPWCWYCNREFDDDKVLVQHQKAKHFKCHLCHKKLYTGPGLAIHCMQVHKEKIERIPNSAPNRGSTEVEIYGMEGIPEADLKSHEAIVLGKIDEPVEKVSRLEESSTSTVKAPVIPNLASVVGNVQMAYSNPNAAAPIKQSANIPSLMSGMSSIAAPPLLPNPFAHASQPIVAGGNVVPPLAAIHQMPAYQTIAPPPRPTIAPMAFPAYDATVMNNTVSPCLPSKFSVIIINGATIMHPDENLSLEEIRLAFPKYSTKSQSGAGRNASQHLPLPRTDVNPLISGPPPHIYSSSAIYAQPGAVNIDHRPQQAMPPYGQHGLY